MWSLLLLLAALLGTTCLALGAEPTSPRRSLTLDLIPTRPRSDSDKHKCFESMLALGVCKHDLILASFFTERRIPPACCRAADEVDDHCGPFTRTFVRSLLPRDLFRRCARQVTIGAPAARSSSRRRAPPPAPPLATVPRVSGGARAPPAPEAQTSARLPPPRAARASGATPPKPHARALRPGPPRAPKVSSGRVPHPIAGSTSVYLPPPYPVTVPRGKHTPLPPNFGSGTYAPVVSGGPREARAPRTSAVPGNEEAPKPKVITGGSAGGRTRRAPGVYGPATASAQPNYGARTGTRYSTILALCTPAWLHHGMRSDRSKGC